jgi:putative flippase GtrA
MSERADTSPGRLGRLVRFYASGVFLKFLLAGGLAALVNFLSRFALQPAVGFDAAVALAYLAGFLTAFFLNRAFVFPRSGKPMRVEMGWFLLFNLIAFPVVVGLSIVLRDDVFGHMLPRPAAEALAHACAIMTPVVFNFAAHRLVTFGAGRGEEGG